MTSGFDVDGMKKTHFITCNADIWL